MIRTVFAALVAACFAMPVSAQVSTITASPVSWVSYDIGPGASYVYGKAIADFDGDGVSDIIFGDSFSAVRDDFRSGDAIIYKWSAASGLVPIYTEDRSWHPNGPNHVTNILLPERAIPLDVDADGDLDAVFVLNSHDAVVAYLNPLVGGGSWGRMVMTTSTPGAVNLTAGDFDGDGDQDIGVTMRGQSTVWPSAKPGVGWLRNDGGGSWTYADIEVNAGFTDVRTAVAWEIFMTGKPELTVSDMGTGAARSYRLVGSNWTPYTASGVDSDTTFFNTVCEVGGTLQYVYAKSMGIWAANMRHTITAPPLTHIAQFSGSVRTTEIACGDITGDGATDIVFSTLDGGLYYLRRVGSGWAWHVITRRSANYHSIAVADVNGDGVNDVVTTIEYPNSPGGSAGSDASNIVRVFVTQ